MSQGFLGLVVRGKAEERQNCLCQEIAQWLLLQEVPFRVVEEGKFENMLVLDVPYTKIDCRKNFSFRIIGKKQDMFGKVSVWFSMVQNEWLFQLTLGHQICLKGFCL